MAYSAAVLCWLMETQYHQGIHPSHKGRMDQTFTKIGLNKMAGASGFTVEVLPRGGVRYSDGIGESRLDSEWLVKPHRIVIYKSSIKNLEMSRADIVLRNVKQGLEFLGHPVEIWAVDSFGPSG